MTEQTFKTFMDNGVVQSYKDYEPTNVISGDTDSGYFDLSSIFPEDSNKEDIIKFSDDLGEKVNTLFPQFINDVFNVPDSRKHVINTEREICSDTSLMIGKKMYIMHVVNSEGVDVEKRKGVGVSIKKSDTPVIIQNFLKDMVKMILDKNDYQSISEFIKNFKEYYITLSYDDIGKPTNVKNLVKYEELFEKNNSKKGFPYHVRASLFYNSLCTSRDKIIYSGEKVRVVYIKHPDSKYIALPVDSEVLPEFMNDVIIDWKSQWLTVQKKIDIFLKPVNFDKKGLQKELENSFLEF